MTTIVWDGTMLACDSRVTQNGIASTDTAEKFERNVMCRDSI